MGVLFADFGEGMRPFHTYRVRLGAALKKSGPLLHADPHLLAGIEGLWGVLGRGGVLGSHNPQVYRDFG
ncbi:hypothetical protein D3C85_1686310 [compost metagenome]